MFSTDQKQLSFEEYLQYDDGTDYCYELVEGRLEFMNPPTLLHLLISKFLENFFEQHIRENNLSGIVLRGAGIRTGVKKSRIPDLAIFEPSTINAQLNQSAVFEVPPQLVVEIVSPESLKRDYRYKRSEYAALGIPEYWIIDPEQQAITILQWEEGLYEERVFRGIESLISQQFPQLQLNAEQVFNQQN
jgi:Uma2 family endonuclease